VSAWNYTCGTEGTPTLVIPKDGVFLVKGITFDGPCKATSVNIKVQHL